MIAKTRVHIRAEVFQAESQEREMSLVRGGNANSFSRAFLASTTHKTIIYHIDAVRGPAEVWLELTDCGQFSM